MSTDWNLVDKIEKVNPYFLRYSRGLLKSNPQSLFPAFFSYWIPLFDSFDINSRLISINTEFNSKKYFFNKTIKVDDNFFTIAIDENDLEQIQDIFQINDKSLVEYLALRLSKTLLNSWIGKKPAQSHVVETSGNEIVSNISIKIALNEKIVVINFLLDKGLTDQIDFLLKKQIYQKLPPKTEITAKIQLAKIIVPNNKVNEYLSEGSFLDISRSFEPILYINNQSWRSIQIVNSNNKIGFITLDDKKEVEDTYLSVDLVAFKTDTLVLAEISQENSGLDLGIQFTDKVRISLMGQPVANGKLVDFQGKLAVEILQKG